MERYGVFAWDADGDMGYAHVVGPFRTYEAAEAKAEAIIRKGESRDGYIEAIVVPIVPGATGAAKVAAAVDTTTD